MSSVKSIQLTPLRVTSAVEQGISVLTLSHRRQPEKPKIQVENVMYSVETDPDAFPDGGFDAYQVLLGSFCGLIVDFGIPNAMGAIQTYVSMHQLSEYKLSTITWIFSLHLGVMYLGGVVFGGAFDKYGAKRLLIAATICIFTGLMATAELQKLWQFLLFFSILTAFGSSLAMSPLMGVLSHWFLKKRGMALSVASAGSLVGSTIFAVTLPKLYALLGFKWALRILAFICLCSMTISILLIKERPGFRGHAMPNERQEESTVIERPLVMPSSQEHSLCVELLAPMASGENYDVNGSMETIKVADPNRHNIKTKFAKYNFANLSLFLEVRFVALALATFAAEVNSLTVLTYLASFAISFGVPENKAYLLLTVINLSGIPSRIITGFLADRYGRFNIMLAGNLFQTICIWAFLLPANGLLGLLYTFTIVYGCMNASLISLIASCLGQICPAAEFGRSYGTLYFLLAFTVMLGMYIGSVVIDAGTKKDYFHWIVFEGVLSIAGLILWTWARWCVVGFRFCKF